MTRRYQTPLGMAARAVVVTAMQGEERESGQCPRGQGWILIASRRDLALKIPFYPSDRLQEPTRCTSACAPS